MSACCRSWWFPNRSHIDMLTHGSKEARERGARNESQAGENRMIALKNLLLPVDFSEPCLKSTDYAVTLAHRFGPTLHRVHVIEDAVVYLPMFESYPLPTREQFETYAQVRLDNWVPAQGNEDLHLELHWRHGAPHIEVIDYADDNQIDLIIMGT